MALESDTCCVCFLESSKGVKVKEVAELLEALLVKTNLRLFEELLVCDNCLIKVQSASKFKAGYLEKSQKLCIRQEDNENETVCEICKENVNPTDCLPLFYSLTENDKVNLFKFLSSELELKSYDSPQTCELCHKSILNFCIVIKSFSVVVKDKIFNETDSVSELRAIKLGSNQDEVKSVVSTDDFAIDIKEEEVKDYMIDIKEGAELKEEQGQTTTYEDFLCKNEELDLKTEDEPIWSYDRQEDNMFKCLFCDYQTPRKCYLNRHVLTHNEIETFKCQFCDYRTTHKQGLTKHIGVHKDPNEVEIFKCQICDYQSKYKKSLEKHIINKGHKNSNELVHNQIEMFKCQLCDFQAKFKDRLKRHMIVHKKSNEIKMFKCRTCSFQSKYKTSVQTHSITCIGGSDFPSSIRVEFKCQFCNYKTKFNKNLKKHQILHKNYKAIKTFKCQICDYQTKFAGSYNRHVTIHRNPYEIKMFKCHICDYQTKCEEDFTNHLKVCSNSRENCLPTIDR